MRLFTLMQKRSLFHWVAPVLAAAFLSSCVYDPGYGGYGGGYGDPYGYGYSSGINTSVFISTGNPRWGYDPYRHYYYDYHRRCYYDPYRHGYYPVGYIPPRYRGSSYPHGWSPGRRWIAPPSNIRSNELRGIRDERGGRGAGPAFRSRVESNPQTNWQNRANWQNRGSYQPRTPDYQRANLERVRGNRVTPQTQMGDRQQIMRNRVQGLREYRAPDQGRRPQAQPRSQAQPQTQPRWKEGRNQQER